MSAISQLRSSGQLKNRVHNAGDGQDSSSPSVPIHALVFKLKLLATNTQQKTSLATILFINPKALAKWIWDVDMRLHKPYQSV